MNLHAIIRYLALAVLATAGVGIVFGILRHDPALALANIALALSQLTIISLATQLKNKKNR